jgi:hypothetical protein
MQTPSSVDIAHHRAVVLDPLENGIGQEEPFQLQRLSDREAPVPAVRGIAIEPPSSIPSMDILGCASS